MSHRLEVGERRSLASHYTLTTGFIDLQSVNRPVAQFIHKTNHILGILDPSSSSYYTVVTIKGRQLKSVAIVKRPLVENFAVSCDQ